MKCCLCGKEIIGYGNNPEPITSEGRCCDECNSNKVIPARIINAKSKMCIFEDRFCRYANRRGNIFSCDAPSDEAMTCKR